MSEIFSELDGRLSVVQRWTVINTIQTQSVAEHCFNVERIARRIGMDWFDVNSNESLDKLSQMALHHDDDESVIGDIPAPSKHLLGEKYLDDQRSRWYNESGLLHDIVKLADKMEAYCFMIMEQKLGNSYVINYRNELRDKIIESAAALRVDRKAKAWMVEIQEMKGTTRGSATGSAEESP